MEAENGKIVVALRPLNETDVRGRRLCDLERCGASNNIATHEAEYADGRVIALCYPHYRQLQKLLERQSPNQRNDDL
jgi:hypothetical protein